MLYAAAGRREDAARPIPDARPPRSSSCRRSSKGSARGSTPSKSPDPVRRAAEAKPALAEALAKLGESAPLLVRNAAFCTEVLSFGCIKRFDKYEFFQDQEVLLYAEVENFVSEPTAKGFHTSLRSGYQILDDLGRQVAGTISPPTEEYCQNARRDFFIGYHLRLPKQIAPGKYTLRLLIQDAMCQKTGQASIEFAVKEGKAEAEKEKGRRRKAEAEHGTENSESSQTHATARRRLAARHIAFDRRTRC